MQYQFRIQKLFPFLFFEISFWGAYPLHSVCLHHNPPLRTPLGELSNLRELQSQLSRPTSASSPFPSAMVKAFDSYGYPLGNGGVEVAPIHRNITFLRHYCFFGHRTNTKQQQGQCLRQDLRLHYQCSSSKCGACKPNCLEFFASRVQSCSNTFHH